MRRPHGKALFFVASWQKGIGHASSRVLPFQEKRRKNTVISRSVVFCKLARYSSEGVSHEEGQRMGFHAPFLPLCYRSFFWGLLRDGGLRRSCHGWLEKSNAKKNCARGGRGYLADEIRVVLSPSGVNEENGAQSAWISYTILLFVPIIIKNC